MQILDQSVVLDAITFLERGHRIAESLDEIRSRLFRSTMSIMQKNSPTEQSSIIPLSEIIISKILFKRFNILQGSRFSKENGQIIIEILPEQDVYALTSVGEHAVFHSISVDPEMALPCDISDSLPSKIWAHLSLSIHRDVFLNLPPFDMGLIPGGRAGVSFLKDINKNVSLSLVYEINNSYISYQQLITKAKKEGRQPGFYFNKFQELSSVIEKLMAPLDLGDMRTLSKGIDDDKTSFFHVSSALATRYPEHINQDLLDTYLIIEEARQDICSSIKKTSPKTIFEKLHAAYGMTIINEINKYSGWDPQDVIGSKNIPGSQNENLRVRVWLERCYAMQLMESRSLTESPLELVAAIINNELEPPKRYKFNDQDLSYYSTNYLGSRELISCLKNNSQKEDAKVLLIMANNIIKIYKNSQHIDDDIDKYLNGMNKEKIKSLSFIFNEEF